MFSSFVFVHFTAAGTAASADAHIRGPRAGYVMPPFARLMQESTKVYDKTKDRDTIANAYASQKGSDPTGPGDAFTLDSSEASATSSYNGVYYNDGRCEDTAQQLYTWTAAAQA